MYVHENRYKFSKYNNIHQYGTRHADNLISDYNGCNKIKTFNFFAIKFSETSTELA